MKKIIIIIAHVVFIITSINSQWIKTNGPAGGSARCIEINGSYIFSVVLNGGIFISTNSGLSWNQSPLYKTVNTITSKNIMTYAGTSKGLHISSDYGTSWSAPVLKSSSITAITLKDSFLIVGKSTYPGTPGIVRSTDNGTTWIDVLVNKTITCLFVKDSKVFAGASFDSSMGTFNVLYVSTNNGNSWEQTSLKNRTINSMTTDGLRIFAATSSGVYISIDDGSTWNLCSPNSLIYNCVYILNNFLYAGANASLFITTNNGASWTQTLTGKNVYAINSTGTKIFAGTSYYGILLSSNNGTDWTKLPLYAQGIYSLFRFNSRIYAGGNGVVYSDNEGNQWNTILDTNWSITAVAVNDPYMYAGTMQGIWTSSNSGNNWFKTLGNNIYTISYIGSNILAGAGNGIYLSTDLGWNWGQMWVNPINNIVVSGSTVYAGTANGVAKSLDSGITWIHYISPQKDMRSVAVVESIIYAGASNSGVYISKDYGNTWNQTLPNLWIYAVAANQSVAFAGTDYGIFATKDTGNTWFSVNEGIGEQKIRSLLLTPIYLYAGTGGSSVWRRPISQMVGNLSSINSIPIEFKLNQNYPNPFNPSTKIKFDVMADGKGQRADVKLIIYNIQGKEITSIVNQSFSPGTYEVEWNGSNYPSGVYFYKLIVRQGGSSTGDYTETKKMVLVK